MELDLRDLNGNEVASATKQARAEMAGAVPIPSPSKSEDTTDGDTKRHCGYGACHPFWIQMFATAKWFLAYMSVYVLLQSLLVSGYTSSVITTIEKRYDLRSAESGLIVSSFDIGSLLVVVFISYFGGKSHRPRWIGIGSVVVSIGAVLFASPQFISSPYDPDDETTSEDAQEYLCALNHTSGNANKTDQPCEAQEANSIYIFLFVISNMIIGIGSTPIYTLGTTFIYDNSPKEDSSLYIAIMYLMGAIGPAVGYVVGGALLNNYVDFGVTDPPSLNNPNFVGAWWSGYLLCAMLILVTSFPLLAFPEKLPKPVPKPDTSDDTSSGIETPSTPVTAVTVSEEEQQTKDPDADVMNAMDASMSFGDNIKDLPRAFFSLLSNPIFLCITATATLEFSIVTAFLTFVPKYIQNQFAIAPTQASIYTGLVLVPSAGGGILLGGYVIKRLRLNMTGCAKVALLSNALSLLLFISVFLISCPAQEILGVSTDTCPDCSCEMSNYEPVCFGSTTYYNPCKAGCSAVETFPNGTHVLPTVYTNCTCSGSMINGTSGICERDCGEYFKPFMVCLFLVTMATASAQTPALMVTLRCVKNDERPFAMGLQFVFFRALAYIPAPIYFGSAIDRACLIWRGSSDECEDGSGSCEVYDADLFRHIYFGLAFSLKVLAAFFVFLTWYLCRKEYTRHTHTTKWRKERQRKRRSSRVKHEEKETRGESTYGSVYGRSQIENMGSSLPGSDGTGSSSEQLPRRNQNNNGNQRPVSHIGEIPKPAEINTVSSSESDSSMNSAGSQKPLISTNRSKSRTQGNSVLNAGELGMMPEALSDSRDENLLDIAL